MKNEKNSLTRHFVYVIISNDIFIIINIEGREIAFKRTDAVVIVISETAERVRIFEISSSVISDRFTLEDGSRCVTDGEI